MAEKIRNIAHLLRDEAARQPRNRAVVFKTGRDSEGRPSYSHLTFGELDASSDRMAWGMQALGMKPGMNVLLMIRPSPDFFALVFALFKVGAVPVMIDPGMGWGGFLNCVSQVSPEGFIGVPEAQLLRLVCGKPFSHVKVNITLGCHGLFGGCPVSRLPGHDGVYPMHQPSPEDPVAILFTSGSTGPAKGVTYTNRILATQVEILRREYSIGPGDMDLACFPQFSLFTVALGACAVVPRMDPTRPAQVDPREIIEPIKCQGITYSFGSPALWTRVARYCMLHDIRLHGLRRVIMAGAPVPGTTHDILLKHVLDPDAETFTPYGATESLPIANFRGSQMLEHTRQDTENGAGMCVGRPLDDIRLRIIKITDEAIPEWNDNLMMPDGQVGEICVSGPVVTREYYAQPDATRLAKIRDGSTFWHRIGDLGYLDADGLLWFCGRKSHRVEPAPGQLMFTVQCEAIFNAMPGVRRSALVGVGPRPRQTPVIVIEPEPAEFRKLSGAPEKILATATANPLTAAVKHVLFRHDFPVDVRHNAKINREKLSRWASEILGGPAAGA